MADATPESTPAAGEKKKDAVLDLFQTEVAEESHLGNLAGSLKDINAEDLLKEAVDTRDWLKGRQR